MSNNYFFETGLTLYNAFCSENTVVKIPTEYLGIVKSIIGKLNWKTVVVGHNNNYTVENMPKNNKVMVGLSGGLDSVYLMHRLMDIGYDVIAVHISGLNKQYAKIEEEQAKKIAKNVGVDFISVSFKPPKQILPDNPFKNQLILSIMLNVGVKMGVYNYAIGSDLCTSINDSNTKYTLTDCSEILTCFWEGVKSHFPQADLILIQNNTKKYHRLRYLFENHKFSLENISSCIYRSSYRFYFHDKIEKKFDVKLMYGRCGSCYKCCMEYILLCELGFVDKNVDYYNFCWHKLATSSTSHRPELFDEKLPLKTRLENLMNYGS